MSSRIELRDSVDPRLLSNTWISYVCVGNAFRLLFFEYVLEASLESERESLSERGGSLFEGLELIEPAAICIRLASICLIEYCWALVGLLSLHSSPVVVRSTGWFGEVSSESRLCKVNTCQQSGTDAVLGSNGIKFDERIRMDTERRLWNCVTDFLFQNVEFAACVCLQCGYEVAQEHEGEEEHRVRFSEVDIRVKGDAVCCSLLESAQISGLVRQELKLKDIRH